MGRTTVMDDSDVGDEWIRQATKQNPTALLQGMDGMISTGPVRLAFPQLFEPRQQPNAAQTPKYGTMAIYTPFSDMSVIYNEYYRLLGRDMPEFYVEALASTNPYPALEPPFHDQAKKTQFGGFTPGLIYINHTSKYKPTIIDANRNPVVDPAKVYPGVWAILVIAGYTYGKSPPQPRKGCAFGLQGVMLIGDDKQLGGGGIDVREVFKDVKVTPPAINPAALAGMVPQAPTGKGPAPVGFRPAPPPPPMTPLSDDDDDDISSLR